MMFAHSQFPEDSWSLLKTFGQYFSGIIALAIVVGGRWLERKIYRPKIAVEAGNEMPFTQAFFFKPAPDWPEDPPRWIMLRLRLCNEGNEIAKDVSVSVTNLSRFTVCDNVERDDRFVPFKLVWTHGDEKERKDKTLKGDIPPGTTALIDIGKVYGSLYSKTRFDLVTEVPSSNQIWSYGPGKYRMSLQVYCLTGPLWVGSIDVSFDTCVLIENPKIQKAEFHYNTNVVCNVPSLGLDHCSCG